MLLIHYFLYTFILLSLFQVCRGVISIFHLLINFTLISHILFHLLLLLKYSFTTLLTTLIFSLIFSPYIPTISLGFFYIFLILNIYYVILFKSTFYSNLFILFTFFDFYNLKILHIYFKCLQSLLSCYYAL